MSDEFGSRGLGALELDVHDGFPDELHWCWHHAGTTRMSDDPRQGVVDRHCRVHGIGNLYVAGSSVFPTAGCDMPTLTIVALAHSDSPADRAEMQRSVRPPAQPSPEPAMD